MRRNHHRVPGPSAAPPREADDKIGESHRARMRLFARGLRRRFVTVEEIERALPSGSLTDAERWLLYYSLHAAEIEIRGDPSQAGAGPPPGGDTA